MERKVDTVAVIGAGVMGRGIMQWAAETGAQILAFDSRPDAAAQAIASIADQLARSVEKGRMTALQRDEMLLRIKIIGSLKEVEAADIVVEAIVEDLGAKQALLSELESVVRDATILCTNTSSLSVTSCAKPCKRPQRVAGLHFFNPAPIMRVVEIIRGERTLPQVIERLTAFVGKTKHHAVVCSDTPGFVVNHAGRGLYTEGLRIIQEGVATFADVDRVMRDCLGFPMGPFELFDLTGLDVSSRVLREIYESFFQEPRYRPTSLVYRRVEAGLFGRKVGEGFYRYDKGRKIEPAESPAPDAPPAAVCIAIADPHDRTRIAALLASGGMSETAKPDAAAAIIVAPLGRDATSASLAGPYNARRVVAIDPLMSRSFEAGGRITLMTTPITDSSARNCVHAALARAGARVTCIADSPGFIAQRIIATIVNIGCEIAQQRIARPADIEQGVRLGLGYPAGPLTLGDQIGSERILTILNEMHKRTGDPRYRPSLWLTRRAELKIPLTTAE